MANDLNEALLRECWGGNEGGVLALLRAGASIAQAGDALVIASSCGHDPVVRLLVARGVDIHFDNDGPLKAAVLNGKIATIRLLVSLGANPGTCTNDVLDLARQLGHAAGAREVRRHQKRLSVSLPTP